MMRLTVSQMKVLGGLVLLVIVTVIAYQWNANQTTAVAARTVREAGPLILAGMCGLIGERSGIINIGIEGQMLMGAFCGFIAASYSAELWGVPSSVAIFLGVLAATGVAALLGWFLAWSAVTLKMDQIIAGTVINIFAVGATSFFFVQSRTMPFVKNWAIPGLEDLPVVGKALFSHGPLTYVALLLVPVVHLALFSTRWGLRTRAVGEHPGAADTVGVNIFRLRYANLVIAGVLAGLSGMHLLQSASAFQRGMSNGKGFIALAVMIFGRWRPTGVLGAALLFGFFNALQTQLQFNDAVDIPSQFFGMIPFLFTIIVLAISGLSARPPAAAGQVYEKS